MSARSFARWRLVPGLAGRMLGGFAAVQARSETDALGLRQLGVARIDGIGDLKAAAPPLPADPAELARLRAVLAGRPVWLAASTHPGEETLVFDAHRCLAPDHPGLLTIIVPRHPQRGAAITASAPDLATARRALGEPPPGNGASGGGSGVWIADTLDELGLWYRLADIAFIGRSLVAPGGGQNPLEPARLGCAIAVGPHVANFAAHVAALRAAGGLEVVEDAAALAGWVDALLRDPARRAAMAAAAEGALRHDADLPARVAAMLLALLPAGAA
jgi:3-deoxy-D-manno-octulosonic-acid transferase